MSQLILILQNAAEDSRNIKSLLEKVDGRLRTFKWLRGLDDLKNTDLFRQYDVILAMNMNGDEVKKTDSPQEWELGDLKSRFVTMANHEFRTPLTSIASSANLVEAYVQRGEYERVGKHIANIKDNINDLNSILSDFLSLDRLETGHMQSSPRQINLPELVNEVCADFNLMLKSGQAIVYEHTGSEIVDLDPKLLKNILSNLISNASKYSPVQTTIDISTTISAEKTVLRVTDHGIGIPPEDKKRLFSLFYRARNAINVQGTGLGLYVAKCYVELMQGNIGYSSELGEGATFWVEFNHEIV